MARKTTTDTRFDALLPWLALGVLAIRAAGRSLRSGAGRAARWLSRLGASLGRGLRATSSAAGSHGRTAAAAARPLLAHRVWPRLTFAATALAAIAVLVLAKLGESAEHALTVAGIHAERFLAALGEVFAVIAAFWLPRAWRWVVADVVPRLLRRLAADVPRAGRWTAARLPGIGRALLHAALAAAALALLALPALHVASLSVDVSDLPPLADRSELVASDGSVLAVLHAGEERSSVPLERIPDHVRHAVLAAEDRRFYDHPGYDVLAVGRATLANLRAGRVTEGASTITQQLAKQNFTGGDRTLARKVRELVYAIALERAYAKDELVERYLNQVYFGAGAHGVAVAAWEYFRAAPDELTADEAALLAGLIRSPSRFDPRADHEGAAARRDAVLVAMVDTGALSAEQATALADRPVELAAERPRGLQRPHLTEGVRRELLANPALGADVDEREERLRTGGLRVETTIDVDLQDAVADLVAEHLPDVEGPTAAVAVVEPGTGRVRALHGGRDFRTSQFDLALQARRQPGSLFKPFVAVAALEAGVDPAVRLPAPAREIFDVGGERWTVRNYGGVAHGSVTLETALARSVNTTFAALAVDLGTDALVDVLERVGIDSERALGPPAARGPSIGLGGVTHGVSPLEMAAAYAALVDEGRYTAPHLVARVTGPGGEVLYDATPEQREAVAPVVAEQVVAMLRTAVEDGTGLGARLEGAAAGGKTGTTQHGADAWFAGVTDGFVAAVWVGHPDGRTPMPQATGGGVAAPLWRAVAEQAVR